MWKQTSVINIVCAKKKKIEEQKEEQWQFVSVYFNVLHGQKVK